MFLKLFSDFKFETLRCPTTTNRLKQRQPVDETSLQVSIHLLTQKWIPVLVFMLQQVRHSDKTYRYQSIENSTSFCRSPYLNQFLFPSFPPLIVKHTFKDPKYVRLLPKKRELQVVSSFFFISTKRNVKMSRLIKSRKKSSLKSFHTSVGKSPAQSSA